MTQRQTRYFQTIIQGNHVLTSKVGHVIYGLVCFMVFSATFNNIIAISWRSVLLVEETGVPRENHRPVASH